MESKESLRRDELRRLDTRILRGSSWVALGYGGHQALTFVSMLVLVRLLDPEAFGLVALASPFLIALLYLQESGLGAALIHRRGELTRAASTVLVFSPTFSVLLYSAAFLAAPTLASLLREPQLADVLRVLALVIVIRSIGVVPGALLERELRFGARAAVELGAANAQFAASIGLALAGFGVWSLVLGQLAGAAASSTLYWTLTPLRPNPRRASVGMLRELVRYGRYVSAGNLLVLLNTTADNLVIGRILGTTQLGFYAIAYRLGTMPVTVVGHIVGRVMFSAYATLQDDLDAVRRAYVQNLQRIAILALPASVLLLVAARPIVVGLLGERWSPAIVPLQLVALYGLTRAFLGPSGELFKGLGRPSLNVVFGVIYAVVVIPALLLLVPALGIEGAPLALWLAQLAAGLPSFVVAARMVRLTGRALGAALVAPAAPSLCVALVLLLAVQLTSPGRPLLGLAIVASTGLAAYLAGVLLFARGVIAPMWASLRAREA